MGSRELGVSWLLDAMWRRLGIAKTLKSLFAQREYGTAVERLIFAMTLNRAMALSSKLAMEGWVAQEVCVDGLASVEAHQLCRAMDFLLESADEVQGKVFSSVANLFNLEVDVIFFDTTTTHFEVEGLSRGEEEEFRFRRRGYSKDERPDLGQIVIGFAMTRDGIPVKAWSWAGDTSDQTVMEEVKQDLNGWKLCYKRLDCGLDAKEVIVGQGAGRRRFVVVRNPEEEVRDRAKRADIVREVERRRDSTSTAVEPNRRPKAALAGILIPEKRVFAQNVVPM